MGAIMTNETTKVVNIKSLNQAACEILGIDPNRVCEINVRMDHNSCNVSVKFIAPAEQVLALMTLVKES